MHTVIIGPTILLASFVLTLIYPTPWILFSIPALNNSWRTCFMFFTPAFQKGGRFHDNLDCICILSSQETQICFTRFALRDDQYISETRAVTNMTDNTWQLNVFTFVRRRQQRLFKTLQQLAFLTIYLGETLLYLQRMVAVVWVTQIDD